MKVIYWSDIEKKRKKEKKFIDSLSLEEAIKYINDEDVDKRKGLAERKDLPKDIIEKMSYDEDFNVKWSIFSRDDLDYKIVERWANSDVSDDKKLAAKREEIAPELIIKLSKDENVWVRRGIAERKEKLPPEAIDGLILYLNDNEQYRELIASREDLTENAKDVLSKDPSEKVREKISGQKNLSEEIIDELSKDEHWHVRANIAEREHLSEDIIKRLSCDNEEFVRLRIAERKDLSVKTIEALCTDYNYRVVEAIVGNESIDEDLREKARVRLEELDEEY